MPNFVSYIGNEKYKIGCTGQTVLVYDKNGTELAKFKGLRYAYDSIISPNGDIFVVKTTEGILAVFSLKTLTLIKKFRFSKITYAQDDGFCFSADGKYFLNVERQADELQSAISVYETSNFTRVSQLLLEENIMINCIEQNEKEYYVLGFLRNDDGIAETFFVGKYENNDIKSILGISEKEYWCYSNYIKVRLRGNTDISHSLAKLWSYYSK